MYQNLKTENRTLFLRQTGDNYRAALKHMPTQQMSFSILNLKDIVSSPLGQFTVAAWRGKGDRKMLSSDMIENFEQLDRFARHGITLKVGETRVEDTFNVVVMYVCNFSHSKEILGRVKSRQTRTVPILIVHHLNGTNTR